MRITKKYQQLEAEHKQLVKHLNEKDKELDFFEKQLEEKTAEIQELNNMYTLMNQHLSASKGNQQYLEETNRKLQDENIELKAKVE